MKIQPSKCVGCSERGVYKKTYNTEWMYILEKEISKINKLNFYLLEKKKSKLKSAKQK